MLSFFQTHTQSYAHTQVYVHDDFSGFVALGVHELDVGDVNGDLGQWGREARHERGGEARERRGTGHDREAREQKAGEERKAGGKKIQEKRGVRTSMYSALRGENALAPMMRLRNRHLGHV
jgi:hypothetical protein